MATFMHSSLNHRWKTMMLFYVLVLEGCHLWVTCNSLIQTIFRSSNLSMLDAQNEKKGDWKKIYTWKGAEHTDSVMTYLLARNLLLQTSHWPASHSVCSWCVFNFWAEFSRARANCSLSSVRMWTLVSISSPTEATSKFLRSPLTFANMFVFK